MCYPSQNRSLQDREPKIKRKGTMDETWHEAYSSFTLTTVKSKNNKTSSNHHKNTRVKSSLYRLFKEGHQSYTPENISVPEWFGQDLKPATRSSD